MTTLTRESKDEYVKSIASDLDWLKIKYDETFIKAKELRDIMNFSIINFFKICYPCFESSEDLDIKKVAVKSRKTSNLR